MLCWFPWPRIVVCIGLALIGAAAASERVASAQESVPADLPPAPTVPSAEPAVTESNPSVEPPMTTDAVPTGESPLAPAVPPSNESGPPPAAEVAVEPNPPADPPSDEPGPSPLASIGYVESPEIIGTPWRVHDINRPRPRIVLPQHADADSAPRAPPSDAIVLFDGRDLSRWRTWGESPEQQLPAQWKLGEGYFEVVPGTGRLVSIDTFGDCQLHLEFQCPPNGPEKQSQERSNSGVFLMGLYEFQVLDSFENFTYADGQLGAIYSQVPPLVNAALPPEVWQTYDIIFETPRFDGEQLIKPAFATVLVNGVLVHHHRELGGPTRHKTAGVYRPHPPGGPIMLQDHGDPIRYRNIWVRPLSWED